MDVHRDEHATGLIRVLSIGLRVLTRLEYGVRRQLAAHRETRAGLSVGNAKRATARPTAERLLEAFQEITLTVVEGAPQVYRHVTVLSPLHVRILELLGCSSHV
jgi:transposase